MHFVTRTKPIEGIDGKSHKMDLKSSRIYSTNQPAISHIASYTHARTHTIMHACVHICMKEIQENRHALSSRHTPGLKITGSFTSPYTNALDC